MTGPNDDQKAALFQKGEKMLDRLRGTAIATDVTEAVSLAGQLKDMREFAMLALLANEGLSIQAIIRGTK